MSAAFTPGPWSESYDEYAGGYSIRSASDPDYSLARAVGHGGADEANARLIAAAPELLEACELVRDEFATGQRWTHDRIARVVEVVRAAIAKAEGGEP